MISQDVLDQFHGDLLVVFGGAVDRIELVPDMLANVHTVRIWRGDAYAFIPVSDRLIEDLGARPAFVDRIATMLRSELEKVLAAG